MEGKYRADFLRDDLDLVSVHLGCEHGVCGACTIRLDGGAGRACLTLAVQADGADVETVECLAADPAWDDLRSAFVERNALQCGYCTPGMLASAAELLAAGGVPTRDAIRDHLSGNYCRCTGYHAIVDAVEAVARADAPRDVVEAALRGSPPVPFRAPPGVALVRVQTEGGATITEAFRPGTENAAQPPGEGLPSAQLGLQSFVTTSPAPTASTCPSPRWSTASSTRASPPPTWSRSCSPAPASRSPSSAAARRSATASASGAAVADGATVPIYYTGRKTCYRALNNRFFVLLCAQLWEEVQGQVFS